MKTVKGGVRHSMRHQQQGMLKKSRCTTEPNHEPWYLSYMRTPLKRGLCAPLESIHLKFQCHKIGIAFQLSYINILENVSVLVAHKTHLSQPKSSLNLQTGLYQSSNSSRPEPKLYHHNLYIDPMMMMSRTTTAPTPAGTTSTSSSLSLSSSRAQMIRNNNNKNANASFSRIDGHRASSVASSKAIPTIRDPRLCDALREELGLAASTSKKDPFYKVRRKSLKRPHNSEAADPNQDQQQTILRPFVNKAA